MAVNRFSKAETEDRRLCPVCPGLPMGKLDLGTGPGRMTLDACGRCGGIWFDAVEVDRLRHLGARALEAHVTLTPEAYRKRCGNCDAAYPRNDDRCPACKAPNELRCPSCAKLLTPIRTGTAKLDTCRDCQGVWVDSIELKEIWNTAVARRRGGAGETALDAASSSMDTFLIASWLMPNVGAVGGGAADLAGGAIAIGADAGSGLVEGASGLASSIFDAIADLLAGIFE